MSVDSDRHGAWKDGETVYSQVVLVEQRYVSRGGQRPAADESTSLSFHASTAEPRRFRTPILLRAAAQSGVDCLQLFLRCRFCTSVHIEYNQIFTCLFGLVLSRHCIRQLVESGSKRNFILPARRRRQRPSLKEDARENKKDAQRCLKW